MSAIQDLQPYIEAYPKHIREARDRQGITLQRLIDESGVAKSAINNLSAGTQVHPKLFDAAAVCKVLGLSLDEMFGLEKPSDTPEGMQQRIHELELENVQLTDEVRRVSDVHAETDKVKNTVIYALMGFCALLVLVVIGYMIFDAHILNAGLFQSAGMSAFAVLLAIVLIGALGAIVRAMRIVRKK